MLPTNHMWPNHELCPFAPMSVANRIPKGEFAVYYMCWYDLNSVLGDEMHRRDGRALTQWVECATCKC